MERTGKRETFVSVQRRLLSANPDQPLSLNCTSVFVLHWESQVWPPAVIAVSQESKACPCVDGSACDLVFVSVSYFNL